MKNSIAITIFAVALSLLSVSEVYSATNTTLQVSVPPIPGSSRIWESISTQTVDNVLVNLPGEIYPANFTSSLAEELVQDLNSLKFDLQNEIATALAADSDIKQVYSVTINMNPITASLSQQGTSIGLNISDIQINVDFELETQGGLIGGIFCPSPDAQVDINGLLVSSSYDVYTGQVGGFNTTYSSLDIDTDCGGILGFIGDAYASLFIDEQGKAEDAIEGAVANLNNITNKITVFSIRDFAEALLDSDLLQELGSDLTIEAVDEVIAQTNLNSGVIVDIEVYDGSTENIISISAKAEAPVLGEKTGTGAVKQLPIIYPAGSNSVSIYVSDHGGPLVYVTTTNSSFIDVNVNQASHLAFVAIAHSDVIPGLRSNLSNTSFFIGDTSGGGPRGQ